MDTTSLLIGMVVAIGLGFLLYTQRGRINALRSTAGQSVTRTVRRLNRSINAHYRDALIEMANGLHVAGHLVPLEQIAVMPRFYKLREPYQPDEEDDSTAYDGPLNLIPLTPNWPQFFAPYRIDGIPLQHLLRGSDNVLILGLPGSGRTVALALTAILLARQNEARQPGGLLDEVLLPMWVHMADVDLSTHGLGLDVSAEPSEGQEAEAKEGTNGTTQVIEVDPLSPLLAAARTRLGMLAGRAVGAIRGQFAAGCGVILIDGWDELPQPERQQAVEWLRVLMETYPGNRIVMTGPARGYGPLQALGFAPVHIMPWDKLEYAECGKLWSNAWPEIGGTRGAPALEPEPERLRLAVRGNRARSPLDVTLKIWATFARDDPGLGRVGWYEAYVNRVSPAAEFRPALEKIALQADDSTGITVEEATALVAEAHKAAITKPAISPPDFIYDVVIKTHLLSEHPGERLTVTHPVIGAYLMAEGLRNHSFVESLLDGRIVSDYVLSFMAQTKDLAPYVEERMNERRTVRQDKLLAVATWVTDAPSKAPWRGEVFKRLAQALLTPNQYPEVRERVMAALVASRDANVRYIFQQGIKHDDIRVRVLSILGLGSIGDPEMAVVLGNLLEEEDENVEIAATLALGALQSKAALNEFMVQELLVGREMPRRAAAEMMSSNLAGEGHEVLREAARENEAAARKAAVYGLWRAGPEDWVMELLDDMERHDPEWLVRVTATSALEALREDKQITPKRPVLPEETGWLETWLFKRNESLAPGPQGISQMIRALQEGDEHIRMAAAEALGALGLPEGINALYAALVDKEPTIRDSAFRALSSISNATGYSLPGVI
nr:HEAT repeat domain-containing protein [Anaerolineae bacterium]